VVKFTSENALKNSQKKRPERPRRSTVDSRKRVRIGQIEEQRERSVPGLNCVFLVGFMGAGKTSVGRALGQRLNWLFEDLDDRIQQREGRTIAQIFRDSGEAVFRTAEHNALRELLSELQGGAAKVVALGGGAFVQPKNAKLLKASAVKTLFLDAPVEQLWDRCCKQASETGTERPLLQKPEQFRTLHLTRRKSYLKASERIETNGRSVEQIADAIILNLGLKKTGVPTVEGEVE
jgi:shikimate kinase